MNKTPLKYWVMFVISVALLATASVYTFVMKRAPQAAPQEETAPEAKAEETPPEPAAGEEVLSEETAANEAESTAIDLSGAGILGVAKKQPDMFDKMEEGDKNRKSRPITLQSSQVSVVAEEYTPVVVDSAVMEAQAGAQEEESARTMLTSPVGYKIITAQAEYDNFKKTAYGDYPKVDFSKKSFLILESKNNLPDNIFEIKDARKEGDKYVVDYGVNILGLKERAASHTYAVIDKDVKSVELKQVM
ncbi:MAG: hypothetical protein LBI01_02415 [Elusimicrobium sp.]|jgi:hypothetical protein|nr:hypothetical protein [Elusimicrobium sp.]